MDTCRPGLCRPSGGVRRLGRAGVAPEAAGVVQPRYGRDCGNWTSNGDGSDWLSGLTRVAFGATAGWRWGQ